MSKKIFGVDPGLVNEEVLRAAAAKLEIADASTAPIDTIIKAMVTYFRDSGGALLKCDTCGGVSTGEYDLCPFCGTGEDDAPAPEATAEEATAEVVEEETEAEESAAEEEPAPEPVKANKGGKKPPTQEDANMARTATATDAAKTTAPTKAAVKDAVAKATAPAATKDKDGKTAEDKKAAKTAIVKAPPPVDAALVGLTPVDLDNAVGRVVALKTAAASDMWKLGAELKGIHERQLWKLRTDDTGKGRYRSFEVFCAQEIGMSGTQCYKLIDISNQFDEEQVKKLGTTKLGLVLQAPKEDQAELLKEAEGTSSRQLVEKVKAKKAEKGIEQRETGRKVTPKSKGRASEHIAIAQVLGRKRIALFAKPANKKDQLVEAKSLEDQPFGMDDLPNGVREMFAIQKDSKGNLVLVIDRKRLDESK